MTPRQQTMAAITSIFLLPGLVFAAGLYTWWRFWHHRIGKVS